MFIFLGLLGLSLATWIIPLSFAGASYCVRETPIGELLARFAFKSSRKSKGASVQSLQQSRGSSPQKISVLVPVHNEEQHLSATLESIEVARGKLHSSSLAIKCEVHVALDNCTDQSGLVASRYAVDCFQTRRPPGKWHTLRALAERTHDSDWVILCDAGTIWPADFLLKLAQHFSNEKIVGIAPAYRASSRAFYSRIFWWFESLMKSLENYCGGPVTVHGATVAYRARPFFEAMNVLWNGNWKNDDVVVPLLVRSMQKGRSLMYLPQLIVSDQGSQPSSSSVSFWRRRRMAQGNSEWIRQLWISIARRNPLVAIVSLRRVFRLFWAYWIGLLVVGIGTQLFSSLKFSYSMDLAPALFGIFVFVLIAVRLRSRLVSLVYAGLASIEAPLWLLPIQRRDVRWA